MSEQASSYTCPSCTGPLHFDSDLGKLKCDYCDSIFTVAEIEEAKHLKNETEYSASGETWKEDDESMQSLNCSSCGAQLICDSLTAATSCPYCGNPTIVHARFAGSLKPDCIIPFKINREKAVQFLEEYYSKKKFLPKEFKTKSQIEKIQGLYVPFWLFDGEVSAECLFDATTSRTYREGDYRITETSHYNVHRSGTVGFEKIPADASTKMPDILMDNIEPYDYGELSDFSTAYLPGFLADKYDVTAEENAPRADGRAIKTTLNLFYSDVTGYERVTPVKTDASVNRGKVRYAFLPVWLINTKWRDKTYLFAMNGQTGKFAGELPVDKKKIALVTAAVFFGSTALSYILTLGDLIAGLFS